MVATVAGLLGARAKGAGPGYARDAGVVFFVTCVAGRSRVWDKDGPGTKGQVKRTSSCLSPV